MFYCQKCANKNDWPESISRSYGACEICRKVSDCFDVPSSALPIPKAKRDTK